MTPFFKRALSVLCLVAAALAPAPPASAQTPRPARLLVTVVDPTGGVIAGASVTAVGLSGAAKSAPAKPAVTTNDTGLATITGLVPGQYSIQAEFTGFDLGLVQNVRLQPGDNKHVVVLPLKGFSTSVSVGGTDQTSASARDNNTFGLTVPTEQIDSLSDDPTELQQQINDLAGPDAVIRVDSFEGQQLPPKSQIKSIHITRDQFAAETEQPGSTFIDIVTQAGAGRLSGGGSMSARDNGLAGVNQITGAKPDSSVKSFNGNYGGPIAKNRADFSISGFGDRELYQPILNTLGTGAELLNLRQTDNYGYVSGLFNYALTKDQTLKIGYSQAAESEDNLGVGGYVGPDGAFNAKYHNYGFRAQEAGPIGRRLFINSRLSFSRSDNSSVSAVEAQKIIIGDSGTTGGAQQTGTNRTNYLTIASDIDYVRGINSWRFGFIGYGSWLKTDQNSNYLGTWTFANQAAFDAGQAQTYTRTVGDPNFSFFNAQGGMYVQDDLRISKSLTLSPGVRYSLQTRVHDATAFEPRFGVTWAPFASGHTTIRVSAGTFHSWMPTSAIQQALRVDGQLQTEILAVNPTYDPANPDPIAQGQASIPDKYIIGSYNLQQNLRSSAGVDQVLSPRLRINLLYNYIHTTDLPRGENLNPLVNGARPDPTVGNEIETVTDGEIRRHEFAANLNLSMVAPSAAVNRPLFNWRRLSVAASYQLVKVQRDVLGPFDVPPGGTLSSEWGPGPADNPYRVNVSLNSTQLRNLNAYISFSASDGYVYTETTGLDNNGDGLVNDRPVGVGLNSLRTPPVWTVSARLQYSFVPGAPPPGVQLAVPPRYRFGFYVQMSNLTNRANYSGFSGNMLSPFFMKATAVQSPRVVNAGFNVSF